MSVLAFTLYVAFWVAMFLTWGRSDRPVSVAYALFLAYRIVSWAHTPASTMDAFIAGGVATILVEQTISDVKRYRRTRMAA